MTTKLIEVLFFDFGNVCATFDFRRFLGPFSARIGQSVADVRAALVGNAAGRSYGPFFERVESGTISPSQFFHELTRTLNCAHLVDYETFARMWSDIFVAENTELDHLLAKIPLRKYLLSNTNHIVHSRYIAHTAIVRNHFRYWEQRVLSYLVGGIKPDAKIYVEALRRAGIDPSQCLFVDDLAENIAAWETLGGRGIVYNAHHDSIEMLRREFAAHGITPI